MFQKLSESEKKVLRIWAIVAAMFMAILITLAILKKTNPSLFGDDDYSFSYVKDETRYYTVSNAINKFSAFINSKDSESVLSILSDNFIKNNNVTKENVLEKVGNFDKTISIVPSYMCSHKNSNDVTQYIFEADINDVKGEKIETKYYSLYLDSSNFTFSVDEISSEYLGGNCNG